MDKPPYVSEKGFPASVRKLANWAAAQWDRIFEIRYEDTVSPKILLSDEKFSIILPKRGFGNGGGGGGEQAHGGFQCLAQSSSTIRIYYAAVNSVRPDNMNLGDVPPCILDIIGTAGVVCLAVTVHDAGDENDGLLKSAEIVIFEGDTPVDSQPVYYLQLGSYNLTGSTLTVTPGGEGFGVGDQTFELCGGLGGNAIFGPA